MSPWIGRARFLMSALLITSLLLAWSGLESRRASQGPGLRYSAAALVFLVAQIPPESYTPACARLVETLVNDLNRAHFRDAKRTPGLEPLDAAKALARVREGSRALALEAMSRLYPLSHRAWTRSFRLVSDCRPGEFEPRGGLAVAAEPVHGDGPFLGMTLPSTRAEWQAAYDHHAQRMMAALDANTWVTMVEDLEPGRSLPVGTPMLGGEWTHASLGLVVCALQVALLLHLWSVAAAIRARSADAPGTAADAAWIFLHPFPPARWLGVAWLLLPALVQTAWIGSGHMSLALSLGLPPVLVWLLPAVAALLGALAAREALIAGAGAAPRASRPD